MPATALAQTAPDQCVVALQLPRLSRLAARCQSHEREQPVAVPAEAAVRLAVLRRQRGLRRDVGRVAALLQHAVRRVRHRHHRIPHRRPTRASPSTSRTTPSAAASPIRTSATTSRAPRCSTCARGPPTRTARGHSASAASKDDISSVNGNAEGEHRETYDFLFGVTQNLNANAVVESNITYSNGRGYYNDPYKPFDRRPDTRRIWAWLTRYNQYIAVGRCDAAPHLPAAASIRGTRARTWSRWPGCSRCHRASRDARAALHHAGPRVLLLQPAARSRPASRAAVHRRHAPVVVRCVHADACVSRKVFDDGWSADLSLSYYRQKSSWHFGGDGSPGLLDFSARWIEAGIQKTF